MPNRSSISFQIPVRWSTEPLCIKAFGAAVYVAGAVAIAALMVIALW